MSSSQNNHSLLIGYLAAATAITIWAGWVVLTRFLVTEHVDPLVMAVFRYELPTLILAPIWLRRGLIPRGAMVPLIVMTLGWGAPFALLTGEGLRSVPAALFGPLVPGVTPLMVIALGYLIFRERLPRETFWGTILIGLSLTLVLGGWFYEGDLDALRGAPYLLAAALGWAFYTVMYKRSGLSPIEATGYVGFFSLPILVVMAWLRPHVFDGLSIQVLGFHAISQGLITGVVSVVAFGIALRNLGTARASSLVALVPVCAGLGGVVFLGESLHVIDGIAIAATSLGVALTNGAFRRRWRAQS